MNIFNPNFTGRFELFTGYHIITMVFIALLWIIIPVVFKKSKNEKADIFFRYTLASLLLVQHIGWIIWEIITNRFTIELSLPLNLCDISNILCAILLIRKSFKMYEILYFWALAGTIQSYITPNIFFGFPHFEYIAFYIQHGGEILTILYLTIVTGFRPKAKSMIKSLVALSIFIMFVYIFNLIAGSNYMFLMADTPHPSTVTRMIKIFGEPPWHIIGLMLVTVVSILVLYAPFAIWDKFKKSKSSQNQDQ